MSDAYLKSAQQLRELAKRVTDAEARERMIAFAKEYEAISASMAAAHARRGRKRVVNLKEPLLTPVEQFPWRNNS